MALFQFAGVWFTTAGFSALSLYGYFGRVFGFKNRLLTDYDYDLSNGKRTSGPFLYS